MVEIAPGFIQKKRLQSSGTGHVEMRFINELAPIFCTQSEKMAIRQSDF